MMRVSLYMMKVQGLSSWVVIQSGLFVSFLTLMYLVHLDVFSYLGPDIWICQR